MTTEHGCDRLRRPGGLGHKINGERAGGDSGFHLGEVRCEHSPLIKGGDSVRLLQPGTGGVGLSNGVSDSIENPDNWHPIK